jgi:hypothetical protein
VAGGGGGGGGRQRAWPGSRAIGGAPGQRATGAAGLWGGGGGEAWPGAGRPGGASAGRRQARRVASGGFEMAKKN